MAVTNSFAAITKNRFTRKWGGTENSVDPYITGYFYTYFSYLPTKLAENVAYGGGPNLSNAEIANVLRASCLSVTIPGGTMNRADFTGLGGVKWGAPTNLDFDNTITMKFLEFSTLPIFTIMHGWTRMIRDYRTGVTRLQGGEGTYSKSEYSATMYYWTTKPDGKTVEYYSCNSGLFPLKDPTDLFGGDLAYDKLEIDIDFNVDYVYHEPWVRTRCQSLADMLYGSDESIVTKYGPDEEGSSNITG